MAPKYLERAQKRISRFLKEFRPTLEKAEKIGLNESDTRLLVLDVLTKALGYKKIDEITSEFEIKHRYADFAIKLDGTVKMFIEVKAIGSRLSGKDLFQIQSYSAAHNLNWMLLTDSKIWKCYNLVPQNPPITEEAFAIDLLLTPEDVLVERLLLISKEGLWKDLLGDYWEKAKATSPEFIAQCVLSDKVLDAIRKQIYHATKKRVENEEIKQVLLTRVFRGDIVETVGTGYSPSQSTEKTKRGLPASCFAYVPDPDKPSTWKLRYRNKDGSVSPSHLSAAVAALSPGGFRGRRVEIPPEAFPKVKEALYNAYLELGCAEEKIPPGIKD